MKTPGLSNWLSVPRLSDTQQKKILEIINKKLGEG